MTSPASPRRAFPSAATQARSRIARHAPISGSSGCPRYAATGPTRIESARRACGWRKRWRGSGPQLPTLPDQRSAELVCALNGGEGKLVGGAILAKEADIQSKSRLFALGLNAGNPCCDVHLHSPVSRGAMPRCDVILLHRPNGPVQRGIHCRFGRGFLRRHIRTFDLA